MSRRALVLLIAMWCGSLLAVAEWAGAQWVRQWVPLSEPVVLTGDEIGFRVHGMHGDTPMGIIVVRAGGAWVEAELGTAPANVLPSQPDPPAPPPEPSAPPRQPGAGQLYAVAHQGRPTHQVLQVALPRKR